MYTDIVATYDYIDGEMVHSGYFIYGGGMSLGWISKDNIEGLTL